MKKYLKIFSKAVRRMKLKLYLHVYDINLYKVYVFILIASNERHWKKNKQWSRSQSEIYGLFLKFVSPPRKKNLVTVSSQGHASGS